MKHLDYLHLLERWVPDSRQYIFSLPDYPDYLFYAEGSSAHWSIQTNCNVFAAYSVLAADPATSEEVTGVSRDELLDDALSILRGILHGHLSGEAHRGDGRQWGCTWISPLGLERMMHGIEAVWEYLTIDDIAALRRVLIAESDWHTDEHQLVAGLHGGDNKPESNIWSGALLYRTTDLFPDVPRAAEYREKALSYMINGISIPSDAQSEELFQGKKVKDLYIGPNYCENYSLDHHGYLNVGYMVICLSNLAMYHFSCKKRGVTTPPEILRHVHDLWQVVKKCTFADGRLLRIGGDTRARYCYCQDYCIPAWLMLLDQFGDADVPAMEQGWLDMVKTEMDYNKDGSFLSGRLAGFKYNSIYYYTRLEGDRASALSMGAYWRRIYDDLNPVPDETPPFTGSWHGEHHGANLVRSSKRVASWCWEGAQGATGIFLPDGRSDMAEWQCNLQGEVLAQGLISGREVGAHFQSSFPGGFVSCGTITGINRMPLGEGEEDNTPVAEQKIAFAALPDDNTVVCFQAATMKKTRYTAKVAGISWKIPNDVYNGFKRKYTTSTGAFELTGGPQPEVDVINLDSLWLMIDDCMSIHQVYGGDLQLNRPEKRNIQVFGKPLLTSLYCDEICCSLESEAKLHIAGEKMYDTGFVLRLGNDAAEYQTETPPKQLDCGKDCRGVIVAGADGRKYLLLANFGEDDQNISIDTRGFSELSGVSEKLVIGGRDGKFDLSLAAGQALLFEVRTH
jgi:hypothetical protein